MGSDIEFHGYIVLLETLQPFYLLKYRKEITCFCFGFSSYPFSH